MNFDTNARMRTIEERAKKLFTIYLFFLYEFKSELSPFHRVFDASIQKIDFLKTILTVNNQESKAFAKATSNNACSFNRDQIFRCARMRGFSSNI